MAIFTKTDAALPLITQLMQVNLSDEEEVLRFWRRCVAIVGEIIDTGLNGSPNKEPWQIIDATETYLQIEQTDAAFEFEIYTRKAKASGYTTAREYLLSQFREACDLAVKILTTVYEKQAVPVPALLRLRSLTGDRDREHLLTNLTAENADEALLPLTDFYMVRELETFVPVFYIADQTEDALKNIWLKKLCMTRCPECSNIFVLQRKGQTFCSDRCSSRVRQRRYRENLVHAIK